jgi:hypothetical protein
LRRSPLFFGKDRVPGGFAASGDGRYPSLALQGARDDVEIPRTIERAVGQLREADLFIRSILVRAKLAKDAEDILLCIGQV